jgi:hypothetical protein
VYLQFLWDLHDPITTATASPKLVTSIPIFLCLSRSALLIYTRTRVLLPLAFTDPRKPNLSSNWPIPFLCSNNAKEPVQAQTETIPCNYLGFNCIIELSQRGANFAIQMWNVTNRNRISRRCAPLIQAANGPSGQLRFLMRENIALGLLHLSWNCLAGP